MPRPDIASACYAKLFVIRNLDKLGMRVIFADPLGCSLITSIGNDNGFR